MITDDYFLKFEDRVPPKPLTYSALRESLWQFLATVALVVGGWYIWWRWAHSLNPEAMWFALPLALAETFAFFQRFECVNHTVDLLKCGQEYLCFLSILLV